MSSSPLNFPNTPRARCRAVALLSLAALGGCVSPPRSKVSSLPVELPQSWAARADAAGPFDAARWTDDFSDAQLESIVGEALARNFDLQSAEARLRAATASSISNRADIWPSASIAATGSKSRRSAAAGIQQTPTAETYGLNARVAWEIDLWGKIRNGYRADLADEQAAVGDYRAARLSIAASVARAWYDAIEAAQQYELELRILEAIRSGQQIVEENFESGIARALDVRLVRANVADSESSLEQRRRSRDAAIRSLETLLGRYPANEMAVAASLPSIDPAMPVGLPSELLLRRPDVIAAERRLAAAEQRKFEAGKARLPSIDLALTRGTSSSDVSEIFEYMERRIWSQSLNIAQTLFQGGRLKADHERAKALNDQALADYAAVVLTAVREVEDALAAQRSLQLDYAAQKVAADESVHAEALAWEEYGRGLSDITTALDAVRRSIESQRSLIQVSNQRLQSRIDLYLALGGGFELEPPAQG